MSVNILRGKSLATSIAKGEKTFATVNQMVHSWAYSALLHVEEHSDACYVNAAYKALPLKYRAEFKEYCKDLGKVSFTVENGFKFNAKSPSDLPKALLVSPADYKKESTKGEKPAATADTISKAVDALAKRLQTIDDNGTPVTGAIWALVSSLQKAAKQAEKNAADAKASENAESAAPAAVTLVKTEKPAKAAKAAKPSSDNGNAIAPIPGSVVVRIGQSAPEAVAA